MMISIPPSCLRGDWERSDEFSRPCGTPSPSPISPGAEIRFAFEGGELTYVFTRAANRGIAAVTIDGLAKGTNRSLLGEGPEWQSRSFSRLGRPAGTCW